MTWLDRLRTRTHRRRDPGNADAGAALPARLPCRRGRGVVDRIDTSPLPLVRVFGWCTEATPTLALRLRSGAQLQPLSSARLLRDDVVMAGESADPFCGFRVDFLLAPDDLPDTLLADAQAVCSIAPTLGCNTVAPHYAHLLTTARVLGRNAIYGYGPPAEVADEFKRFAARVSGRVLDFGAGSGDLVAWLRARGIDATGIELDEQRITGALKADAREHMRLYPGTLPLPFTDMEFDWITATEVIEHVPDIVRYVPEFARLLRADGHLLLTTPDISSIPAGFLTGTVPWHLLESTHVNFFTPASVEALFASHFRLRECYSLAPHEVNGFHVPGSIGAVLQRC